jgi:hypothetical protein
MVENPGDAGQRWERDNFVKSISCVAILVLLVAESQGLGGVPHDRAARGGEGAGAKGSQWGRGVNGGVNGVVESIGSGLDNLNIAYTL